ncbi:TonB-linked SusC/RagA family outer membrane protein [Pedobacter sp. AK017]|uniref:SusC/RagA family TonB-linked outer membrane protein n=1 Tax=Pedobacter sp. AK017 TaxID=2723073 RepID=UPI00160B50ED|nr:SusC/RagA family TonB-linked outer membrane protein [Pedobacter sp. AK017]MBB5436923.1 TonB-linked SusC/RagA family outer membrane protein [Pedobacter sp. AK017]
MRLTILLLTIAILQVSASSFAQRVTLNLKKTPLERVFKEIRKQTGFDFFYTDNLLSGAKAVTLNIKNLPLEEALEQCLKGQALSFSIDNNIIVVQSKPMEPQMVQARAKKMLTGKVFAEGNLPFAGVVVREKANPHNQTVTNRAGEFSITVDGDDAVLQFSYIGYDPLEFKLREIKEPLIVNMKMSLNDLDQVQVTAYGTTTKRLNAGNITTITAKDIEKNPVNNVMEALQGKVPGLFIQQVTGQPGGAFNIRMRNATNFAVGATPPLIIVDGVRYPAGTLELNTNVVYGTSTFLAGGSGLNYINPNDIESIDVLKDVDATAIYGSSGAYGVILISTKKAKMVSSSLNANVYSGVSVIGKMPKLLNTEEYLTLRKEAFANDGLPISTVNPDVNGTWPADRYHDWQKEFLGSAAVTSNMNVSYSGGGQNTSYLISGSLRDFGNIQRHTGSNGDGSLRFALNTNTNDNKFSLSLTGTYLSSKNDMVPFDASGRALAAPNAPPAFKDDGAINWEAVTDSNNGLASSFNRTYKNVTNNFLANATLVYRPTNKITLRSIFGYSSLDGKELIGAPTTVLNPTDALAATKAVSIFHHYNTRSITVSPYGEYNTTIGKKGEISFKLGAEIGNRLNYNDDIQGTGFPSDAFLKNPSAGSTILTSYNLSEYRTIGMYGIIKLVWDNKYIIDINTRRDGSTKFGPGRRFGNFGSGALAWIFSEENFIKNNVPFLSFGKLRVSSGVVGGDAVADFAYLGTYRVVTGNYDGKVGLEPTNIPNPILNWERNFNSEIGLEMGFFKDRITTDFSYYYNRASNQLIGQPLSTVTGFSSLPLNSDALIRTSGLEANFSTINIKSKNLNWTTRFNISFPKSKLLKVPAQSNQNTNYVLDKPVTGIKLYNFNGVNPETGYYSFTNAKGVTSDYLSGLTQADKTEFIDLAPKYFGGLTNAVSYKQLSLDFTFTFTNRMARNILSQTPTALGFYGSASSGTDLWLRRWQKPGDETDVPRVSTNISNQTARQILLTASTGGYSNAKYARLQNASLRYNFGPKILKSLHLRNLSVYAQGQNLFTISSFDGLDPENLNVGVIPPLRTFTFGLNLTL